MIWSRRVRRDTDALQTTYLFHCLTYAASLLGTGQVLLRRPYQLDTSVGQNRTRFCDQSSPRACPG